MTRTTIRATLVILVFLGLIVGIPLLTPLLNGLKPAGLPLGYALVSQGIAVLLALAVALVPWSRADGT